MNTIRILLVEDDKFLRRACEIGLKKRGFQVLTANDGEEGLQLARAESPDIILLDMLMPKLNGMETLGALKQDPGTSGIPVVILSNTSMDSDLQRAKSLGAIGYLVKASMSLQELGDRVLSLLEEAGKKPE
ncbi:MAG: response regulator [Acidobacteriota bacterium]|jgi:CheY-like chemotaxis protein|nr:response regulator [Acidobacteriota bacterium]